MSTQGYRIEFKDVLERTFLPEGIFIEERNERLFPLSKHIFEHIPSRLFRYRDCSEMKFDDFHVEKTEHAVTLGVKSGPSKAKNGLCCYSFLRFSRSEMKEYIFLSEGFNRISIFQHVIYFLNAFLSSHHFNGTAVI